MLISQGRRNSRKTVRTRQHAGLAKLELLEPRLLLSAVTTTAIAASNPFGITHDNAGNIWVAGGDGLYEVGPDGAQIGATAAPGSTPFDVVFDPVNSHLYFSDTNAGQIVEVGLDGTVLNTTNVPDPASQSPMSLTVATDGSVWFTTTGEFTSDTTFTGDIGRLDPSGNLTFAAIPGGGAQPDFIAAAPDGSVWFDTSAVATDFGGGETLLAGASVGQAHAAADGTITIDPLYSISTPAVIPQGITVATDGSVWFGINSRGTGGADDGPNRLVHGVLSGGTLVQTEYVIPGATDSGAPNVASVALDDSGRLWFTDTNTNHLSYMDTTTGDFTQMALPSSIAAPLILNINDSGVWATAESNGDNLIHVDLATFTPPVLATAPNMVATVGTNDTDPLVAFQTADNGPFTYTVDYGNGQTGSGTVAQNGSGVYQINADATYATAGTYNTTVNITTADGNLVTVRGTAVASAGTTSTPLVGNGIDLSGPEDSPLAPNRTINGAPALAVATFSGPAASYSATINWGNGTSSAGQIVDLGGGMFSVVAAGGKTYSANGTFTGSVAITDGTNSLNLGFTATISDTPLVVSTGLTLKPLLGRIALTTTATFSDDIDSTASWFSATINWGDGTTSSGLVVRDIFHPGKYIVIGLHVYSKKGTYNVLTLIDNNQEGVSATATATIKIN